MPSFLWGPRTFGNLSATTLVCYKNFIILQDRVISCIDVGYTSECNILFGTVYFNLEKFCFFLSILICNTLNVLISWKASSVEIPFTQRTQMISITWENLMAVTMKDLLHGCFKIICLCVGVKLLEIVSNTHTHTHIYYIIYTLKLKETCDTKIFFNLSIEFKEVIYFFIGFDKKNITSFNPQIWMIDSSDEGFFFLNDISDINVRLKNQGY